MNSGIGVVRKAGKDYWCCWCGEAIEKGSNHVVWNISDPPKLRSGRAHEECVAAWLKSNSNEPVWDGCHARGEPCSCFDGACRKETPAPRLP